MKDLSFNSLMEEGLKIKSSLAETAKNASNAIIKNKKITSDSQDTNQRLGICNKCPKLTKATGRCDLCGCFVFLKVKLDFESCPIGKW